MERSSDEIIPPQERPRTGGLQEETDRTGLSSQSSSFTSYGTGDQFNAPGGNHIIRNGPGNHFPGTTFHGHIYFGTKEPFDPLQECLKSLAFLEIDSRSYDIDAAAKGTCEWLLRHKTYKSWSSCDRGLLWIKGKPGSGKSTLLRYVLDHAMAIPTTGEGPLILSFFFHGRGSELQKTPLGLFRSLLHQLLRQASKALKDKDLMVTFRQRCETIGKPGEQWQWHPGELQRFFGSSLLKVLKTRSVWLLVDALDECGEENARKLVKEFKYLLQRLPPSGLKQFHICFTCRHYPILDLGGAFEVCVEDENQKDISAFVKDTLSSFYKQTPSTIPDLITEYANGVFLWALLMVKQVLALERMGVGLKKIKDEIHSVPQELNTLYRELTRTMSPDSLKLMQWICFAMRPLSLDELRWAMLIDADCPHQSLHECQSAGDYLSDDDGMKRRVQTLSHGLAETTSDGKVVQFIHQSVRVFFIDMGLSALDGTAKPDFAVGIAHHRLSRTCIRYLAMEEIGRSAIREPGHLRYKFPLLRYATTSWVAHTKQSDARSVPQEDLLEYFVEPSNTLVERWVRIYRILAKYSRDCPPEGTTLAHVMSRYGVTGALLAITERADQVGINIDGKDSDGRTPLSWAAERGHEAIVQLLVDRGAYIEAADKEGRTPLLYAAKRGHETVVRLLVDRGTNTEEADKEGQTPLSYAAERGHETVVQLLLNRGADIKAKDALGQTPLLWAARNGHEAIVQLLLDHDADIEAADKDGRTPLWWAAGNGHEVVVKLLQAVAGVSPDNGLKGSEQDSGYASASRPGTLMVSSESAFRGNTELPAAGKLDEHSYHGEIQSLASDSDDIGSQASDQTTNEEITGKALMRVFLAKEPQFRALCDKAIAKMERQRFVENLRRLLKSFHKNLSAEADAEAEKAIARLLRSRRGRLRISQQIATHIQLEQEEVWEDDKVDLQVGLEDKRHVEAWLARVSERPAEPQRDTWAPEEEFEEQDIDAESSTSSSDDSSRTDEFPYISELENFLRGARSFQILLKDFMLMFLPTELRHVLLSIPKEHIWVSQKQDLSLANRVKACVEDNTQVRWNWWPLEPRRRMLQDGEARMFWQCTCGSKQWEEISAEHRDLVTKILALSDDKSQSPHWCRRKGIGLPLTTWFDGMFRKVPSAPATSASAAARKYTPQYAAPASPWRHGSSPGSGGLSSGTALTQPPQQGSSTTGQHVQIAAPVPAGQTQGWILFGVQGARRTLAPAQIPVNNQSTDYSVFQELKKCYRTHRGRLRLWLSIWRLEYCEVAKFNRLTLERMVREHKDLPAHQDYQYSPRVGTPDARNPPISAHLFEILFYTCSQPCTWPIPHDCMLPPHGVTCLQRIPKRTRSFERDQTSPIWGFEAVFAVSFAYVFIYHCIMVAGPFAFFGWWLSAHPGDLQTASVPVTIVLGLLSLFWSGAGILTRSKD